MPRTAKTPTEKLAAAAAHYRGQLSRGGEDLIDFGYRLGADQVLECQLATDAIQQLVAIPDPMELSKEDRELCEKSLQVAHREIERFCKKNGHDDDSNPAWRQSLYQGYLQGVSETWQQICEKIKLN